MGSRSNALISHIPHRLGEIAARNTAGDLPTISPHRWCHCVLELNIESPVPTARPYNMTPKMHRFQGRARAKAAQISLPRFPKRRGTTSAHAAIRKPAGDISSVFPSLSGIDSPPLPPRFADLKQRLIQGHETHLRESWHRLLADLRKEVDVIKTLGSQVIPELEFRNMHDMEERTRFRDGLRKRGVGLIRGVVSEREALGWKELVKIYIQSNPSTKGRQPHRLLHFGVSTRVLRPLYNAGSGKRAN